MPGPDWINSLASALLDAEAAIRTALRPTEPLTGWPFPGRPPHATPHSVKTPAAGSGSPTITMAQHEARTLLRAAMPQPIGASPLRNAHARMLAATSIWSAHLLTLNNQPTADDPGAAIAAGLALAAELAAWLDATRWHQACRRSRIRWTRRSAIIAILRHQTDAEREQEINAALRDHPLLGMAEQAETDPFARQEARQRRKARRITSPTATQDAQDLASATSEAETPAQASARMQATAARIAAAAKPAPRPAARVHQLHAPEPTEAPIATTTTRQRGKQYAT